MPAPPPRSPATLSPPNKVPGRAPSLMGKYLAAVVRAPKTFFLFVARSVQRAVGKLWAEFVGVLPRLLFLAAMIALGLFLARQQQERRVQQQQQWMRAQAKQKQVKQKRANQARAAKSRTKKRRQ